MRSSKLLGLVSLLMLSGSLLLRAEGNHPRLFLSGERMAAISRQLDTSPTFRLLQDNILAQADRAVAGENKPAYEFDESGIRILHQSRNALQRISACAYAYRFTGGKAYLETALDDLQTIVRFPTWNARRHFLDAAELSLAAAIGYDWLYAELPDSLRRLLPEAFLEKAYAVAAEGAKFYRLPSNWNQVCNGGIVMAALGFFSPGDPVVQDLLERLKASHPAALQACYAPDGNYAEGATYWIYGTSYEAMMLFVLQDLLGTDFGFQDSPGFSQTALFQLFMYGATGQMFNFADNRSDELTSAPLWYFAGRDDNPVYLVRELAMLREGRFYNRFAPMLAAYAAHLDLDAPPQEDFPTCFFGRGVTPVALIHTGWKFDRSDRYLAVKGGTADGYHAHLDAGSFVYDAKGYRWSMDPDREEYPPLEVMFRRVRGNLWDFSPSSQRWQLLRYNNFGHSTLTLNGALQTVKCRVPMTETFDSPAARGATFDLSSAFQGEASQVVRTVLLRRDGSLLVRDSVTALPGKEARVMWRMVTPASCRVCGSGIVLRQGRERMWLRTKATGPVAVRYALWSMDPKDYDFTFARMETPMDGVSVCGFEACVPEGECGVFETILR